MTFLLLLAALLQPPGYVVEPDSVAPPDGCVVICPPDHRQAATDSLIGGGYQRLSQRQVIPGTLTLDCGDPAKRCDDWALHGHRNWLTPGAPDNPPLIDHAAGLVKLPFPADRTTATYSYAAKPGRWVLADPSRPITPSMLGAAGDGVSDDYHRIAWSLIVAARTGRALHLDRCYAFSGSIELPEITVTGRGADVPGLRMLPDCVEMYRRGYQRPPLADALNCWPAHIAVKSGVRWLTIRDLCIEGAAKSVDWRKLTPTDEDPVTEYDFKKLADDLQNGPTFAGLSVSNQNNRRPPAKVTLENVTIRDCIGSCLIGFADTRFSTQNLTLENSVGCRLMYSALGHHQNLNLRGHGWLLRAEEPFIVSGLTYRGGDSHPWPASNNARNTIGIEVGNVRSTGQRMPQPTHITGLDLDFTGTPITQAIKLCGEAHIDGIVRHHDRNRPAMVPLFAHDRIRGAAPGARITLRTINGIAPVLSHPSGSRGNWQDAVVVWHNQMDAEHQQSRPIEAPVIRMSRQPDSPTHQTLTLTVTPGAKLWNALHVPDAAETPARDCVPTTVVIRDSVIEIESTNVVATRRGATEETPADIHEKPLRVIFVDCTLKLGTVGTPENLRRLMVRTVQFVRCYSPDGEPIG